MMFAKWAVAASMCILLGAGGEDTLQKRSREEGKNIAVYFCGSDWCGACNKFKKDVLNNTTVDSLLSHSYVYYVADFPQRKKQPDSLRITNEALAEKLNKDGVFPKLVIANQDLSVKTVIAGGEAVSLVIKKLNNNIR